MRNAPVFFSFPARFRTREKMRAKPEWFPRVAKTEHRRPRSGRRSGATMLELCEVARLREERFLIPAVVEQSNYLNPVMHNAVEKLVRESL